MNRLIPAMPTFPASSMRREQGEIFRQLEKSPILFTHHGSAAGVLVHPDLWNRLIELLEDKDDTAVAQERLLEEDAFVSLAKSDTEIDTEFARQVSDFIDAYRPALEALAR